jgi:hypothetical protein
MYKRSADFGAIYCPPTRRNSLETKKFNFIRSPATSYMLCVCHKWPATLAKVAVCWEGQGCWHLSITDGWQVKWMEALRIHRIPKQGNAMITKSGPFL